MTRALNLAAIRDAASEDRLWATGAIVKLHEGEAEHWRVNEDGDIEIQIVTHAHEMPAVALLGGMGIGGRGVIFVPDVGTEGLVVFDDGDAEGTATFHPRGSRPGDVEGLAAGKLIMVGASVVGRADSEIRLEAPAVNVVATSANIDDGGAGAEPLVRGLTYNAAFGEFLTALDVLTVALQTHVDPLAGVSPDPVLALACVAFSSAVASMSGALPTALTEVLTAK